MKVGALTSKFYAFKARAWELKNVISLDFFDFSLNSLLFSFRGFELMRVLPLHTKRHFIWLTDKTRFFYDALTKQRILANLSVSKTGKQLTLAFQVVKFLGSFSYLWSYYPYDVRFHASTYVNYGDPMPIGTNFLPGYAGMSNKSRIDFYFDNVLAFGDLMQVFSMWWYWYPWAFKKGNFDFRSFFFTKIIFNKQIGYLLSVDFQYQFPSLVLQLKNLVDPLLIFTFNFSWFKDDIFSLGLNSLQQLRLLLFKHRLFVYLFECKIKTLFLFTNKQINKVGSLFDLRPIFLPKNLTVFAAYEFFGRGDVMSLTNKPVDTVVRFSSSFLNYKYKLAFHDLIFNFETHYHDNMFQYNHVFGVLLSTYTVFELTGTFLSFFAEVKRNDGFNLFMVRDKFKLNRIDDFLNFITTFFVLIIREYEDEYTWEHGTSLFGEYYATYDFPNARLPVWSEARKLHGNLSKIPVFFFKYCYFSGALSFSKFNYSFALDSSKLFLKSKYDNFFLTDSLTLNSPMLSLAYQRFHSKHSYF